MTTIKCVQCGHEIEITEALKKDIEQQIAADLNKKYQTEIEKIKQTNADLIEKTKSEIRQKAISEAQKAYEAKIKQTKELAAEQEKQNLSLQKELSETLKSLRLARDAEGKLKIEFEKKLLFEQEKIKQTAKQEFESEQNMKMAEKDKKIQDMEKQVMEMKRKLEQGSQQTQGEVLELKLEEALKNEFPFDEISEVPKGIRGADIIQTVRTRGGLICGTIVWELKNTKNWSPSWVQKLVEDQRALKAEVAILISNALPEGVNNFGQMDKIWVSNLTSSIPLCHALRQQLMGIKNSQLANEGKATKAESVYNYLIGNDFKQRIEVWVEYFRTRKEEIDKERIYYNKRWEKEEKNIIKVMENTAGIYGDLQGVIGNALPKIDYLELPGEVEEGDLGEGDGVKKDEQLF